jgi:DNA-binding response OmpR family regulator
MRKTVEITPQMVAIIGGSVIEQHRYPTFCFNETLIQKAMRRNKKLLIIDDEMDACLLMARIFRTKFKCIDCAYSLTEALEKARLTPPDVILMDNNLPDGLGIEHIGDFRRLQNGHPMEVVMTSALDIRIEALAAGADYFIAKPISASDLPW